MEVVQLSVFPLAVATCSELVANRERVSGFLPSVNDSSANETFPYRTLVCFIDLFLLFTLPLRLRDSFHSPGLCLLE